MKKILPNITALGIIEENIKEGKSVLIKVKGYSMSPLLLDGIDEVRLVPFIKEELKRGDVILFRYKDRFVLHRIIEINVDEADWTIATKGDANKRAEETRLSDIVALAELPEIGYLKLIYRRSRIALRRIFTAMQVDLG